MLAPGQKVASWSRSWLAKLTRVRTSPSRARVIARSALVWSLSGTSTRKRWLSVRASSASTKLSKLSDFPPATLNRGRIALTWLGCTATTASPASSSRSINKPSGRSSATSTTSKPTSLAHNARIPGSLWR